MEEIGRFSENSLCLCGEESKHYFPELFKILNIFSGQKFAMLEVKSIVSKLLRNFHIGPPGADYEPIFTSELVFHSLNGMNVVLKERELCKS